MREKSQVTAKLGLQRKPPSIYLRKRRQIDIQQVFPGASQFLWITHHWTSRFVSVLINMMQRKSQRSPVYRVSDFLNVPPSR